MVNSDHSVYSSSSRATLTNCQNSGPRSIHGNLDPYQADKVKSGCASQKYTVMCWAEAFGLCTLQRASLQPGAKEADHSNWRRPTLTRLRLSAICDKVI